MDKELVRPPKELVRPPKELVQPDELVETILTPDEEINIESVLESNSTLELLMNKSQYNKIFKGNSTKMKETQKYFENVKKHKKEILEMVKYLLNRPDETITRDIDNAFASFTRTCIDHLETIAEEEEDEDEPMEMADDMMFGTIDPPPSKSFWGTTIKKYN
jgi:hypothetical protein